MDGKSTFGIINDFNFGSQTRKFFARVIYLFIGLNDKFTEETVN